MDTWYVYLLRTRNGTLYTGIATDVERRLSEHGGSTTRGARSLRGKGPLELVFQRAIGDRGLAQRVEARIKNLTRDRKEQLIRTDPDADSLLVLLALSICVG